MILTVFRSRLRPDTTDYPSVAREMLELARTMPGFISFKTFEHADGERCSIVVFADWESNNAWGKHPRHLEAQRQGRSDFYSEFSINVAEVKRATTFERQEATFTHSTNRTNQEQLTALYEAFNARHIEAVLAAMQPDVQWANGLQGGFVQGRDAVREYWRQQFEQMQPHLTPLRFQTDEDGREVVSVHQVVRDLKGVLILKQDIKHRFTFENGLVRLFEIVDFQPFKPTSPDMGEGGN